MSRDSAFNILGASILPAYNLPQAYSPVASNQAKRVTTQPARSRSVTGAPNAGHGPATS